ncbi:type I-E CRISPR-associated protein Cse1/CasA [Brevibacterium sp. UMB1308A]|uniref:type I-E CRISPR-associated protein Cse1/CasA n=1 Tax=Brevibacterium sp. UMB1308A TaxID=3050608 RepID=UPI00254B16A8|nr:type I-E CRISPR-associated protein Cse1/CasA [Brevibacterium sp. UMB1308A]MDK8347180.1 type I-E CRISPR-associated protein Cse1/CasA [Brevibacterium sp. UMB1308B]MDK8713370.1 type I-E CRISPR-associated protein Cse1/CasA [Brevibacterium sp. UMB1308A]
MKPTFNLLDEPWIKVRTLHGDSEVVGLKKFFKRCDQFATFDGETPTQNVAIFRLLMAIYIQTIRQFDGWADLSEKELWEAVYDDDEMGDEVCAYLEEHRNRFWLISPDTPFYQVADLHTKKGEYKSAAELVPDAGPSLFSTQTRETANQLPLDLAARWLVHRQAYDFSGIKTGVEGDPRVKGGRGYPIGPGWAGNLGHTLLTGATLKDLLLLNLPVSAIFTDNTSAITQDLAPWEREPDTACPRTEGFIEPNGVVDILTWQQRRIRLFLSMEGTTVHEVIIANGDRINPQNCFPEPYSAQRYSANKSKKGVDVYFARDLDPVLTVWSGVQATLMSGGQQQNDKVAPVVEQLRGEVGAAIGEAYVGKIVGLWLVGMTYGTNRSLFTDEISEILPIHLGLLTHDGQRLRQSALEAIDVVFKLRGNLRRFYRGLKRSLGGSRNNDVEAPLGAWISRLETEFTHWLSTLNLGFDAEEALKRWLEIVRTVTLQTVRTAIEETGPRAAIGVVVTDENGNETLHNAARYELWIRARIRELTQVEKPLTQKNED